MKTQAKRVLSGLAATVLGLVVARPGGASTVVVLPNTSGGDSFTNAGTTNTGQAVGASGWYYNNVRNNGVVGVNGTYPRAGNGSVQMQGVQGPGGNSSKADIEFFATATANSDGNYSPTSAIGSLGDLSSFSYEWYRASGGSASQWLHPVLRLQVFDPATSQFGYLVFEGIYNGLYDGGANPAPTDTWVGIDILTSDYRLWSTGTLPNNINGSNGPIQLYDARTITEWQSDFPDYLVVGVSAGIGSGWGTFDGAVDNITFGFSGADTTYNFEVSANVVPEPATFATAGLAGLAALAYARRRRRGA